MKTSTDNPVANAFFNWVLTMIGGLLIIHLIVRFQVEIGQTLEWLIHQLKLIITQGK